MGTLREAHRRAAKPQRTEKEQFKDRPRQRAKSPGRKATQNVRGEADDRALRTLTTSLLNCCGLGDGGLLKSSAT
jgi:hypothetical protein